MVGVCLNLTIVAHTTIFACNINFLFHALNQLGARFILAIGAQAERVTCLDIEFPTELLA